jgi:hypothetical protein
VTKFNTLTAACVALLSVSFLASSVVAADMDGVMMKDGKMMMMKDGKAMGPMDHEMAIDGVGTIMPDGTIKMKDGHMKEGQSMTMEGKMMQDGKPMEGGMGMKDGMGMGKGKMGGMGMKPDGMKK